MGNLVTYLSLLFFLFLQFSIFPLSKAWAQKGWRTLNRNNGLASNTITSIAEDLSGDIWIGTPAGLCQYTGFITVPSRSHIARVRITENHPIWYIVGSVGSAFSNRLVQSDGDNWKSHQIMVDKVRGVISDLLVTPEGIVWTTTNEGIKIYDGSRWRTIEFQEDWPTKIVRSNDGNIWASGPQKVYRYLDGQFQAHTYTQEKVLDTPVLLVASSGTVWIGTDVGLYSYNLEKGSTKHNLKGGGINAIVEAPDSTIWVGTDRGVYSRNQEKWQPHLTDSLNDITIYSLAPASNGTIWAGGNGLYSYNNGKEWQQHLHSQVTIVFESSEGIIFAGGEGLKIYDPSVISSERIYLSGQETTKLTEATDGTMWAVGGWTSPAGVFSFDGHNWQRHLKGDFWFVTEVDDGTIWAGGGFNLASGLHTYDGEKWRKQVDGKFWDLLQAADGIIWAASNSGLYRRDTDFWRKDLNEACNMLHQSDDGTLWAVGEGIGVYRHNGIEWQKEIEGEFWLVKEVANGDIWVASKTGDGLQYYDGTNWHKVPTSAQQGWVTDFQQTADGTIWVVHPFNVSSLSKFDGAKLVNHPAKGRMWTIFDSSDGVLWLGTQNNGVRRIDGNFWYDLTVADGLPSNRVHWLTEDKHGNLWIPTDSGIFTYRYYANAPVVRLVSIDEEELGLALDPDSDDPVYRTGAASVNIVWEGGDRETDSSKLLYQTKIDNIDAVTSGILENEWSQPVPLTFYSTPAMANGEHIFSVRSVDHHFNRSQPVSLSIIVNTTATNVSIIIPTANAVVGNFVDVVGNVIDDDLEQFIIEYAIGKSPTDEDYKQITKGIDNRSGTLVTWHTNTLPEGVCYLRLRATDFHEHVSTAMVSVRIDNTKPKVQIIKPRNMDRLGAEMKVIATASDAHLKAYVLQYTTKGNTEWQQIFRSVEELGDAVDIERKWEVPNLSGFISFSLVATDQAGNEEIQTIELEIPPKLSSRNGGLVESSDQYVNLYVPPGSLQKDLAVTVNQIPQTLLLESALPNQQTVIWKRCYEITPANLSVPRHKPMGLSISYHHVPVSPGTVYMIAQREPVQGIWKVIGGTEDAENRLVQTTILSSGQYGLIKVSASTPVEDPSEKDIDLTCQPRVFSPVGNAFSLTTAISFGLTKPANVTVKVYNVGGKLVQWIARNQALNSGKQVLNWDGRNYRGEIVPTGLYIVTVTIGTLTETKVVSVFNQ